MEVTSPGDGPAPRSVELQGLTIRAGDVSLLQEVDAKFPAGQITVIVGASGAGKTLLLRILAGLIPPAGGPVTWEGTVAAEGGAPLGRVGILFQAFALFDELSPTANVRFAIDHRRDRRSPAPKSAPAWLEELRVPAGSHVATLSGGQKQRLALARTLAADPEVLLYDEPTSGLDAASSAQVAALIRKTQEIHQGTSIIVTHDASLLAIADRVFLLDAEARDLVPVERAEWNEIAGRVQPIPAREGGGPQSTSLLRQCVRGGTGFLAATGDAVLATLRLPFELLPLWSRPRWGLRFLTHYLRLVAGPSAFLYLILAGMIVGFTTTYFTFRYLPQEIYTKPLLIEDLLSAIGFALFRVLTPILATVLVAARCGAAVAADVGVKRYGAQVEALQTLGVRPRTYLLTPILIAFVIGTPLLAFISYQAARVTSMVAFASTHPEQGPHFWLIHYEAQLGEPGQLLPLGTWWLVAKTIACGIGVAAIAFHRGMRPKASASDVSDGITSTVLWATLYVLVVHFTVAFLEF